MNAYVRSPLGKNMPLGNSTLICIAGISTPAKKSVLRDMISPSFAKKVLSKRSRKGGIFRSPFGENIGRMDKLSRSCEITEAGLSYGGSVVVVAKILLKL